MHIKRENQSNIRRKRWIYTYLPSLITSLRIIFPPSFLYTFFLDLKIFSFLIFFFLSLTDVLDGYIARKMDTCSFKGAYFDIAADFILILVVFTSFT